MAIDEFYVDDEFIGYLIIDVKVNLSLSERVTRDIHSLRTTENILEIIKYQLQSESVSVWCEIGTVSFFLFKNVP